MAYTDDFNRANDNYGLNSANWTQAGGTMGNMSLISNAVAGGSAYGMMMVYTAGSFSDDQYSQCKMLVAEQTGPTVRGSTSAAQGYTFWPRSGGGVTLTEWTSGPTKTEIAYDAGVSLSANDILRIEISGSNITCKVNGSTVLTHSDSTTASGRPGIGGSYSESTASLDDWEGGDLSTQSNAPRAAAYYRMMRNR